MIPLYVPDAVVIEQTVLDFSSLSVESNFPVIISIGCVCQLVTTMYVGSQLRLCAISAYFSTGATTTDAGQAVGIPGYF